MLERMESSCGDRRRFFFFSFLRMPRLDVSLHLYKLFSFFSKGINKTPTKIRQKKLERNQGELWINENEKIYKKKNCINISTREANDRIVRCRIIGILLYCRLVSAICRKGNRAYINQANRAKKVSGDIYWNEWSSRTDGSSGREESHALQLIYISSAWVGPARFR